MALEQTSIIKQLYDVQGCPLHIATLSDIIMIIKTIKELLNHI